MSRLLKDIGHCLDHWQSSGSLVLGGAAALVGLVSGAGVWLFKCLIDVAHLVACGGLGASLGHLSQWMVALVPVVSGKGDGLSGD